MTTAFTESCLLRTPCQTNVSAVIQSKQLRKMIQQTFQQYAMLKEDDCMVKFFETLKNFVNYDEEVFPCELVVSPCHCVLLLSPATTTHL